MHRRTGYARCASPGGRSRVGRIERQPSRLPRKPLNTPWPQIAAGVGAMRRQVFGKGDVGVARAGGRAAAGAGDALQLLIGHRSQEIVGIAGARKVVAGDAHAPNAQVLPAFRRPIYEG